MTFPIRGRLTFWYVSFLAAILLGVEAFLVTQLRVALIRSVDESLAVKAEAVAEAVAGRGETELRVRGGRPLPELSGRDLISQLLTPQGRVLQSGGEEESQIRFAGLIDLARGRLGAWRTTIHLPGRSHPYRIWLVPLTQGQDDPLILLVGRSLAETDGTIHHLILLLSMATPAAVALAAFGGWILAGAAMRPIDAMTRAAARIDPARPHQIIPLPKPDDELSRLAHTLNKMLERLHRALDEERRFTADASHELRTPLSVMVTELDVAVRSSKTPTEAKEILESVGEEVRAISRIVDNLLVLSRTEATGRVDLARRPVNLLDLARAVVARFRWQAVQRGVDLRVEGLPVEGWVDRERMLQVLANLLENGITYTDRGGQIQLVVGESEGAYIEISDSGIGIPPEALPRIFDRFFRVDQTRGRASGGAGLGLAIAWRLVEAHGGRIDVESKIGQGTTFRVHLPRSAPH
jgi:signal transduction histidine kinase